MKVDRTNPLHWFRLFRFGLAVACAIFLRPLRTLRRRGRRRVLFYGHRLAGNLRPIHDAIAAGSLPGFESAFLTMDPVYRRKLADGGTRAVLAGSAASIAWLASADALVSDHGLHAMQLMLGRTDLRFYDAWHGIPFKGFDAEDFRIQRQYHETWVASAMLKNIYVQRFGFDPRRVYPTGYARTDVLVNETMDAAAIRREFGLPEEGKLVLFAPTWKQDHAGRSLYPFNIDQDRFLELVGGVAEAHGAFVAIRMHLNADAGQVRPQSGVAHVPFADYPDTERLLLAADILVCDWSSIAFDYLLLRRPTIFLDVPQPFRKGLTLDASFRYGEIAESMDEMLLAIGKYLADPGAYRLAHGERADAVLRQIYGDISDGAATARCLSRLHLELGRELTP